MLTTQMQIVLLKKYLLENQHGHIENPHLVHIHAREPQIQPLDFNSVCEVYPLKFLVGSENTL